MFETFILFISYVTLKVPERTDISEYLLLNTWDCLLEIYNMHNMASPIDLNAYPSKFKAFRNKLSGSLPRSNSLMYTNMSTFPSTMQIFVNGRKLRYNKSDKAKKSMWYNTAYIMKLIHIWCTSFPLCEHSMFCFLALSQSFIFQNWKADIIHFRRKWDITCYFYEGRGLDLWGLLFCFGFGSVSFIESTPRKWICIRNILKVIIILIYMLALFLLVLTAY